MAFEIYTLNPKALNPKPKTPYPKISGFKDKLFGVGEWAYAFLLLSLEDFLMGILGFQVSMNSKLINSFFGVWERFLYTFVVFFQEGNPKP